MVRQGVRRRSSDEKLGEIANEMDLETMVMCAEFNLVSLCILLVLAIQATGATTSIMSLAIDHSIEPSTAVKS